MSDTATASWPGSLPGSVLLSHATGFCKEVWVPFVEEFRLLGPGPSAIAWDYYSHGSSAQLEPPADWWRFGDQAAGIVSGAPRPRIGVGHSMGAAALAMVEVMHPGSFDALVLVEPIILPPPYEVLEEHPMSVVALKRRPRYESRDEARTNFEEKPVFASWDPRALGGYIAGGLIEVADGVVLACTPAAEAAIFAAASNHGLYDRLGELAAPSTIVAGEHSDTVSPEYASHLAQLIGDSARAVTVAQAGHFVPMEQPAALAQLVYEVSTSVGSS